MGVGSGPRRTSDGVGGSMFGDGSKNRGGRTVSGLCGVGVASAEPAKSMNRGVTGETLLGSGATMVNVFRGITSTVSSSGVRRGTIAFQSWTIDSSDEPGVGGRCDVYLMRMSCHRSNNDSGTCNFQLTAFKKAISLVLISSVFKPDILLQARAE